MERSRKEGPCSKSDENKLDGDKGDIQSKRWGKIISDRFIEIAETEGRPVMFTGGERGERWGGAVSRGWVMQGLVGYSVESGFYPK